MKSLLTLALACFLSGVAFAQNTGGPDNQQTVNIFLETYTNQNFEPVLQWITEDVRLTQPGTDVVPFAGRFLGRDGVNEYFNHFFGSIVLLGFSADPMPISEGNRIKVNVMISGTALSTNQDFTVRVDFVFTFDDEAKIIAWEWVGDMTPIETAFTPPQD